MTNAEAPVEITVYTLPWCMHCARAKALLRHRGLPFREVDGRGVPQFRRRLLGLTGGSTVPQIMINGKPAGGADRLAALDRVGVLVAIASGEQFPLVREVRQSSPLSLIRWASARLRGRQHIPSATCIRVTIDRAGQVVGIGDVPDVKIAKEEHDGEGMCRTSG